jgi:hypothetical protein
LRFGAAAALVIIVAGAVAGAAAPKPLPRAAFYVSPKGSDSNVCTQARPCRSFDRAARVARPGQVVEVADGTYGDVNLRGRSKSGQSPIVFQAAPGATPSAGDLDVRNRSHLVFKNLEFRSWYVRHSSDITFRNVKTRFFFVRSSNGVRILGGSVGPSQDGTSPTIGNYAGDPVSKNILVDRVLFHDIGRQDSPGSHVECLFLQESSGVVIRRSKFTRCDIMDLYVSTVTGGPMPSNVLIENNWFDEPTDGGSYPIDIHPDDGSVPRNFTIRYNSLSGGILIYNEFVYDNVTISSNIGRITYCPRGVTFSRNFWSNRKCGATDKVARSGYVDPAHFDFHLARGSAAIAGGDASRRPVRDVDGDRRPSKIAPDAGADQREPATLNLGGQIGRIRLGSTRAAVEALKGSGSASRTRVGGRAFERVTYRVPAGRLWALYSGDTVVGVGTSSRAYSTTGGLGAGSDRTRIPRPAVRSRCKAAMRTSRGSVVAYWGGAGSKVAWLELLRKPYGGC